MALPTKAETLKAVRWFIAGFTSLRMTVVQPVQELRKPPLLFNDDRLVFLATSLRGYIKDHNPDATLLAKDTKKGKLTVQGLADIVYARIHS